MHVSIGQWIAIAVFAGLAALATRNLGVLWRGSGAQTGSQPNWWARGVPVGVVAGWAMLVGALLTILTLSVHGAAQTALIVLLAAVLAITAALFAIWLTVVLFGRPRRAVPPPLRDKRRRPASGRRPAS